MNRSLLTLAVALVVALFALASCDEGEQELTTEERCTMYVGCTFQCIAEQSVQGDVEFSEEKCEHCVEFSPWPSVGLWFGQFGGIASGATELVRSSSAAGDEPLSTNDISGAMLSVDRVCSEYR